MAAVEDEIMTLLIAHLATQPALMGMLGTRPFRCFPGDVPLKVDSVEIKPPWVNLERGAWEEEMTFSGGTGIYKCPTSVVVIAATVKRAAEIFAAVRDALNGKWSVTWSERLCVGESTLASGNQVALLEADGSPSQWQQIVGDLYLQCSVSP